MPVTLIVGGQWGDEGKAKIIDYLAAGVEYVVRYQGGANAGHTVVVGDQRFAFHLVPSGILYPDVTCILGGGMVIDPTALVSEIDDIVTRGIDVTGRIMISSQAHLVLPHHIALDKGSEDSKGSDKIGTTKKGISPAYVDKAAREGVRMADLRLDPAELEALLRKRVKQKNAVLKSLGLRPVSPKATVDAVLAAQKRLRPMITDTRPILWEALDRGARVLCEGAQGALLDIDHGTYPFVTSSSATAGGAAVGTGLPPSAFTRVVGIFKAYCTRVGNGPFPTEDEGRGGDRLRNIGHEFGTTTGRPRRCGWFDAVAARTAVKVNGVTDIALTKLDVLDGFRTLKVCTSYKIGSRTLNYFPADARELERVRPRYETLEGWNESTNGCSMATMPERAIDYVRYLERIVGCRIHLVSLGPERQAMIKLPRAKAVKAS